MWLDQSRGLPSLQNRKGHTLKQYPGEGLPNAATGKPIGDHPTYGCPFAMYQILVRSSYWGKYGRWKTTHLLCVALPICVSIAHHEASILQLMINPLISWPSWFFSTLHRCLLALSFKTWVLVSVSTSKAFCSWFFLMAVMVPGLMGMMLLGMLFLAASDANATNATMNADSCAGGQALTWQLFVGLLFTTGGRKTLCKFRTM